MAGATRSPVSAARILYAGIVASTLMITAGGLALSLTLGTATTAAGLPDWLALGAGGVALTAAFRQWKRIRAATVSSTVDAWWTENTGRALLLWGLVELAVIAGSAAVFATGHLAGFVTVAVLALGGLGISSPGRLAVEGRVSRS